MTPSTTRPVAIITGAARGIGLASTHWFLARDHDVVLIDNDEATLTATAQELSASPHALPILCDVSDPDQVQAAFAQIDARFGRADALVNNAGVAVFKTIGDTSFQEWRHVLATNLDGAFLCSQACVPLMLKSGSGGSIVNIASISGLRASTLRVAYGTSKA
ncbi:MAG: SDR family oxidoreductase, partial [Rhodoferax sp.]|nr:SDR family oxidoreductase [Rhodoferax sp.]